MASNFPPTTPLEREYLPVRAKILEIASALDRIQRSADHTEDDPRWDQLQAGINLLFADQPQRAEHVQLMFSRPYDPQWRQQFDV
ncbi:MAG: hypothetical protein AAGD11_19740 [Planctomycetota bacterium]